MLHAAGLLQGLSSICLLPMTSKEKRKCQFGYSEILRLLGKLHLRGWACFSFLLSSFSLLVQYIAFPPSSLRLLSFRRVSLFLPSLYFNSDFVLFFLLLCFSSPTLSLFISLSPVSSLWGSFGSERRFGARLWQYFTLIKRMVGSTVGATQRGKKKSS